MEIIYLFLKLNASVMYIVKFPTLELATTTRCELEAACRIQGWLGQEGGALPSSHSEGNIWTTNQYKSEYVVAFVSVKFYITHTSQGNCWLFKRRICFLPSSKSDLTPDLQSKPQSIRWPKPVSV